MAGFARASCARWHVEVPGARWFRSDLHVHTLDDHPGGRVRWGQRSEPIDDVLLDQYARALLRCAVSRGVEVIGLTPHAAYCGGQERLSAAWRVVEVWNSECDDDGIPFRDKVYAVFPGFEPSMADGSRGVHLLFLFDPEIGREGLIRAFHAVMDGVQPWEGGVLSNTHRPAAQAFDSIAALAKKEGHWNWLCLAPHAFNADRGLFGQLKSQMLAQFRNETIAGLELGDTETPEHAVANRRFLADGMQKYHQSFFHASDAYILNPDPKSTALFELGSRTTMFKLAQPRIEALRQAFLASDSRIRLTIAADEPGGTGHVPSPTIESVPLARPWLRSVTISGGTSFFGGFSDGRARATTLNFNPDLTCVIGGRMSGKSTLLDGLRVAYGFPLPADEQVAEDVRGRGTERFLSGNPEIGVDICGPCDPTKPVAERWPAVFFTQRELQQAASDQKALRELLFQLIPGAGAGLRAQFDDIAATSDAIADLVPTLTNAVKELGDAEQALAGATAAKDALGRYERVGAQEFTAAQADVGRMRSAESAAKSADKAVKEAAAAASLLQPPDLQSKRAERAVNSAKLAALTDAADAVRSELAEAAEWLDRYKSAAGELLMAGESELVGFRSELEQALIAAGGTAEELNQFTAISETAQLYEERRLRAEKARIAVEAVRAQLAELASGRDAKVAAHRQAMADVVAAIGSRFGGRERVVVEPDGVKDELASWVRSLREKGVTRWWNDLSGPVSPHSLLDAFNRDALAELGMSDQVSETFSEAMTEARRWQLASANTPDRYVLQLLVAPGEYREMSRLSGGGQVSLVLSLFLESDDTRPLVIDQPEDELDKAYLFDVVLPALRRLKGHRQLVFVTHDANIAVNGDADQVVYLKADAEHGWVEAQGAIEQPVIREAVLTVLDGGEAAFELRSRKYGF